MNLVKAYPFSYKPDKKNQVLSKSLLDTLKRHVNAIPDYFNQIINSLFKTKFLGGAEKPQDGKHNSVPCNGPAHHPNVAMLLAISAGR